MPLWSSQGRFTWTLEPQWADLHGPVSLIGKIYMVLWVSLGRSTWSCGPHWADPHAPVHLTGQIRTPVSLAGQICMPLWASLDRSTCLCALHWEISIAHCIVTCSNNWPICCPRDSTWPHHPSFSLSSGSLSIKDLTGKKSILQFSYKINSKRTMLSSKFAHRNLSELSILTQVPGQASLTPALRWLWHLQLLQSNETVTAW